jgi:hypothetical protein
MPTTVNGDYYVAGSFGACLIQVNANGIITHTAPILSRFQGQPLANLRTWRVVTEITKLADPPATEKETK